MSNGTNPVASFFGALIGATEPDDLRRERMQTRSQYEITKIAGIALTAICAVAALYAVINGMLFTTLFFCAVAIVPLDMARIGTNGVNLLNDYATMIQSAMSAASRVGISDPNEVVTDALLDGTMVLGTCLRPMCVDQGAPGTARLP